MDWHECRKGGFYQGWLQWKGRKRFCSIRPLQSSIWPDPPSPCWGRFGQETSELSSAQKQGRATCVNPPKMMQKVVRAPNQFRGFRVLPTSFDAAKAACRMFKGQESRSFQEFGAEVALATYYGDSYWKPNPSSCMAAQRRWAPATLASAYFDATSAASCVVKPTCPALDLSIRAPSAREACVGGGLV